MNITDSNETRKLLLEEKNLLGQIVINDVSYNRKYINNFSNPFVRLYISNIKSVAKDCKIIAKACIIHGFGHHSFDFFEYATFLAKNGISCYLLDLRGHGFSGGSRFDWKLDEFHTDIISLIKESEKENFELPLFLIGHSMGGGLISNLFINNPYLQVHGVIFSAPLLGVPLTFLPENPGRNFVVRNFGDQLKDFIVHGNINPTALTKDDKEIIRTINDGKNIPMATPNSVKSLMKLFERTLENCRNFSLNCLIFHGDKDKVVNIQHTKVFYENIKR